MKKNILIVGVAFLVLLTIFVLARNVIVKAGIERGVEYATGLPLTIGGLDIGLGTPTIGLKNIKLYNPKTFPDRVMIDVTDVYIHYNLSDILKKNYHFPEIRLDLKELVVVRNKDGQVNLDSLKPAQKEEKIVPQGPAVSTSKFQIDHLKLKIGKVIYKDYSQGGELSVKEFPINIEEEFTNVDNLQGFVSLIVLRALAKTSVAQLANFDPKNLHATVSKTLKGLQSIGKGTINKTFDTLKNIIPFGQGNK